jgi:hypothetical protein
MVAVLTCLSLNVYVVCEGPVRKSLYIFYIQYERERDLILTVPKSIVE